MRAAGRFVIRSDGAPAAHMQSKLDKSKRPKRLNSEPYFVRIDDISPVPNTSASGMPRNTVRLKSHLSLPVAAYHPEPRLPVPLHRVPKPRVGYSASTPCGGTERVETADREVVLMMMLLLLLLRIQERHALPDADFPAMVRWLTGLGL